MTIKEMVEELQMYYEAAGFSDIYERELKYKTEDEIIDLYHNILKENSKNE